MARPSIKRSVNFSEVSQKREFFTEAGVLNGTYRVTLEPQSDSLSSQQRAWYFGCIVKALQMFLQSQEMEHVDSDYCHQILKYKLLREDVINKKTGECIGTRIKSITELKRPEMAEYCEKCRDYLASMFGIVVPDPDPNWSVPPTAPARKRAESAA